MNFFGSWSLKIYRPQIYPTKDFAFPLLSIFKNKKLVFQWGVLGRPQYKVSSWEVKSDYLDGSLGPDENVDKVFCLLLGRFYVGRPALFMGEDRYIISRKPSVFTIGIEKVLLTLGKF